MVAGMGEREENTPPPLLEVRGISKHFGEIAANDDVSLSVRAGEIHALLGENGAGKSTLVKIIYGALQPDSGEILLGGRPVTISTPARARELGIGMVFQHFSLFEPFTVTENIALAVPGRHDMRDLAARIREVSEQYGLPLDPDVLVADLSVGERQRVEIVRCLLADPRIIILDEPTSVLTPQEAARLFVTLRRLAEEGRAIVYISHRLEEVRELCHAATILRHGRVVETLDPRQETAGSLARLMVGSDIHVTCTRRRRRRCSASRFCMCAISRCRPRGPSAWPSTASIWTCAPATETYRWRGSTPAAAPGPPSRRRSASAMPACR